MFVLFKIGNDDYSTSIIEGSYKVYKKPVTYDWEDGNYVKHKEVLRNRTSGSFSISFKSWTAYTTFLGKLSAVKTGAQYALTVYSVNTNEAVAGNFFVDLPPELREKNDNTFTPGQFTITIEEA